MNNDMKDLIKIFERIPDERQSGKIKHLLCDVIFIAIIATVASCDDYEEIEEYATENEEWFRKYLQLPNGIPSHDTIERVFSWINPKLLTSCFADWTSLISKSSIPIKVETEEGTSKQQGIIAIDGKTMRATGSSEKKAMHVVSAWFSEDKMVLGQVQTSEKSNEITAIPELLKILDITGNIVTIDAMGTQTKIANEIVAKKADYVLAVKTNHVSLHTPIVEFFNELDKKLIEEYKISHFHQTEKGHGRIETRDFYITDQIKWLEPNTKWAKLTSIGMVVYKSEKNGKANTEVRYFIASIPANAELFAKAVRSHWGVESMHWLLDLTFNEDRRRNRIDNSAINLASLLRLSLNILRTAENPRKRPIKKLRKTCYKHIYMIDDMITKALRAKQD